MTRTHNVVVKCPGCGSGIHTEVTVTGRVEFEVEAHGRSCNDCGYEGPAVERLALDAYDQLVYDFQRHGRDDG